MNAIHEKAQGLTYSESEIDDILFYCLTDTKLFAKVFFPERFHLPFSPNHDKMFEVMDNDVPMTCIIAPRGCGKTTLWNLVYPAKQILFRTRNFMQLLSHTATQAERDAGDLKFELLTNENILAVWDSIKPQNSQKVEGMLGEFSKQAWQSSVDRDKKGRIRHRGTFILPRGWGQQVRGIKFGRFRPDVLSFDDIEGTEEVMSEDQRKKLIDWFYADCLPAVQDADTLSKGEFPWKVIVNGTLLHEDSLLASLRDDPEWECLQLELCNDKLESTWPEYKSTENIKKLYKKYESAGKLDIFNREFRGIPISEATRKFKKDYFQYYTEDELIGKPGLESIVIVDPARTTEEDSCDTAIVCWTFDSLSGYLYMRDVVNAKLLPDDIYLKTAEMAKAFNCTTIGIETTGLGEFIRQPFQNFLIRWGYTFDFVDLKSKGMKNEKLNRISALLPYYRQGRIKHKKTCCTVLEQQLLNFPFSKRLDVMDAAAYIIEMLHLGERFFTPIDASDEVGEAEKYRLLEEQDEPELVYEDAFQGRYGSNRPFQTFENLNNGRQN